MLVASRSAHAVMSFSRQLRFPRSAPCTRGFDTTLGSTSLKTSRTAFRTVPQTAAKTLRFSSMRNAKTIDMPRRLTAGRHWTGPLRTGAGRGPLASQTFRTLPSRSIAPSAFARGSKATCRGPSGWARISNSTASKLATGRAGVRKFSSSLYRSPDRAVYLVVGLNVLGTLIWVGNIEYGGLYSSFLLNNMCVSRKNVLEDFRIHTLLTASFGSSRVFSGVINTVILYITARAVATSVSPGFMLLAYFGGGVFGQLCQVFGPSIPGMPDPLQRKDLMTTSPAGLHAMLGWYCVTFPFNYVYILGVVPIPVVFGGLVWSLGILFSIGVVDLPYVDIFADPPTIWQQLGSVAAGATLAVTLKRRPQMLKRFL